MEKNDPEVAERENVPPEARANAPPEEFPLIIRGRRLYEIHLAIQRFIYKVQRRAFAARQGGHQGGDVGERNVGGVDGDAAKVAGDGGQGAGGEAERKDGAFVGGSLYFRPWE